MKIKNEHPNRVWRAGVLLSQNTMSELKSTVATVRLITPLACSDNALAYCHQQHEGSHTSYAKHTMLADIKSTEIKHKLLDCQAHWLLQPVMLAERKSACFGGCHHLGRQPKVVAANEARRHSSHTSLIGFTVSLSLLGFQPVLGFCCRHNKHMHFKCKHMQFKSNKARDNAQHSHDQHITNKDSSAPEFGQ